MSEHIHVDRDQDVGWIRIDRPGRLNALAGTMREELHAALEELGEDPEVRCVIVTGVGRAFCTGGDVKVMARLIEEGDEEGFDHLVRTGARVVRSIVELPKPVLAAVNGVAAGAGACLALACDLRIASESASIGFGFLRVGLHPDWGGSYFLPRLVGLAVASELTLTGGMVSASRAQRLGIFTRVVPATELEPAARAFAGEVAAGPRLAVREAKRTLRRSLEAPLEEILEMERRAQLEAFRSPDAREGVRAFLEKRAPRFGGG